MNILNKCFNKIYVITCINFQDRHNYISKHFLSNDIKFEFYSSINKNELNDNLISASEKSLAISHLNCIINAKLNNYNNILICEDDVNFIDDLNESVENFMNIVPNDWNFLQFGNQFWATKWLDRKFVANNLYRFYWGTGTHCIAINSNIYDETINRFKLLDLPVDTMYYSLFSENKCYCPEHFIADGLSRNDHLNYFDPKFIFDSTILHLNI